MVLLSAVARALVAVLLLGMGTSVGSFQVNPVGRRCSANPIIVNNNCSPLPTRGRPFLFLYNGDGDNYYASEIEETIQERITRMRAGKLTEDEKRRFLENTLQSNARGSNATQPTQDEDEEQISSLAPLTSTLTRTTRGEAPLSVHNPGCEKDRIKREWVKRILDPDRFAGYAKAKKRSKKGDDNVGNGPIASVNGAVPLNCIMGTPGLRATRHDIDEETMSLSLWSQQPVWDHQPDNHLHAIDFLSSKDRGMDDDDDSEQAPLLHDMASRFPETTRNGITQERPPSPKRIVYPSTLDAAPPPRGMRPLPETRVPPPARRPEKRKPTPPLTRPTRESQSAKQTTSNAQEKSKRWGIDLSSLT